jgi:adenosine deaminase
VALALLPACGSGDGGPGAWAETARRREAAVGLILDLLRDDAAEREAFLTAMPKGADLHSHLSGAISTERLISWGAEDGLCIDPVSLVATESPCGQRAVPLAKATPGSALYQQILTAWSMEGFTGDVLTRHQHFFDAFNKFGVVTDNRKKDGTDEVVRRAAAQGEVHLELLVGLAGSKIGKLADQKLKSSAPWTDEYLSAARETLIKDPQFQLAIRSAVEGLDQVWSELQARWRCGTPLAEPACEVTVRYLIQGTRTQSREYVLGQWVFGFELAQVEPRVVGINLAAPEEDTRSLQNYAEEMKAVRFLSRHNQQTPGRSPVHVSLHAGELIPQVLPVTPSIPQDSLFHIRQAVQVAGAERIGHSADILGEDQVPGLGAMALLEEMARKGVTVEACLTSNKQLLGLEGASHPLAAYVAAGVPFALSTDDEGIFRTNLTAEYVRAAAVHRLSYKDLKSSARTAVEKSFLQGQSLWADARTFIPTPVCADRDPGSPGGPSEACQAFLAVNPRAAQQWKLEARLAAFEHARLAPAAGGR